MTTQPDHHGHELIPRPERTPAAVRVALARLAPHRLSDMEQHKEQALGAALQDGKIGHLQYWLTYWQAQVEIERRPDLRSRYQSALGTVQSTAGPDAPDFRAAMAELRAVESEARQAVSG
ncbi:hypothetical protein QWJ26_22230 [Streptomyces sp. CSDS2]|uniref:hypothetical protein n=1 Tax=Streptomyces sp. CSDS2 TaxID=3055051 RepID=UPI0025AEE153|nr:hypothetical protein [Streptomyces sp. CSDS2]MDN3262473.1 hypothetical protein [Streptomyces sp. CSDS2]